MTTRAADEKPSLWWLVISPTTWALHLLACYVTVAIWCAKAGRHAALGPTRVAVVVYTVVALAIVAANAVWGRRMHEAARARAPHDEDTPRSRRGFLGFAMLLLSLMSAVAIAYGALPFVYVGSCR